MRRLSVAADCKNENCPAVWADDTDPEHLTIVGVPAPAAEGVGPGEVAIRVPRRVIADAAFA
jgi:hypothetical protein